VSGLSLPIWILAFKGIPAMNAHMQNRTEVYNRLDTLKATISNVGQRNALLFTVMLVLGQFTVISFLTPYNINNVGLAQNDVKYIYLVGGISTVISGFFIGKFVDKYGRFRVFTIFAFLSMIPIFIATNLGEVPLWLVLVNAGFFFMVISGRMIPANTIISAVVNPKYRAGFMSLNSSAQSLASGSSAAIAGMIISQADEHSPLEHYNIVGYVAIGATLISLLILRRIKSLSKEN
jgi:predicted MFS family arabinose efflux permease